MIDFRPYVPNHLYLIAWQEEEAHFAQQVANLAFRYGDWQPGMGVSLFNGRELLACVSVTPLRGGSAFVWAVFSTVITPQVAPALYKAGKRWLQSWQGAFPRLEMVAPVNFPAAQRLPPLLGFSMEGIARKWDGERDYTLWARLADDEISAAS